MSDGPSWQDAIRAKPPQEFADALYKRVNAELDRQIAHRKKTDAEKGTRDFNSVEFVLAAHFAQHNLDPGLVASLAVLAIERLAHQ